MSAGQNQVRIFVCDDQMEVREALRLLLKSNGYLVQTFDGPAALLEVAVQAEDREMAVARRVQKSLLPHRAGGERALRYACRFLPARVVSGDYYDFFEKRPGHFGFVVADVSGKGVPAAMLMANLQALFRSHAYRDKAAPEPVLRAVNAQFHESTSPESFATAFYADLDEASQELSYINCGHPPALLRKRSGEVKMLESSALVLGAFPFWTAETGRVKLEEGDRLLVYSDGAVEAQSSRGEEFGEDRLLELFQKTSHLNPQEALPEIEAAIQKHSGVSLFDDCTLFMASLR